MKDLRSLVVRRVRECLDSNPELRGEVFEGTGNNEIIVITPYGMTTMSFNIQDGDIVICLEDRKVVVVPMQKHRKPELVH